MIFRLYYTMSIHNLSTVTSHIAARQLSFVLRCTRGFSAAAERIAAMPRRLRFRVSPRYARVDDACAFSIPRDALMLRGVHITRHVALRHAMLRRTLR